MQYIVYILQCADKTYYTGITNKLEKRLVAHNTGKRGAKYTKSRRPVALVYQETITTKNDALRREWEIKKLTRKEKETLIANACTAP